MDGWLEDMGGNGGHEMWVLLRPWTFTAVDALGGGSPRQMAAPAGTQLIHPIGLDHWFIGLPEQPGVIRVGPRSARELLERHRRAREQAPKRASEVSAAATGVDDRSMTLVLADVPEVGLRAGDVVIFRRHKKGRRPDHEGLGWWLPLDAYQVLRQLRDTSMRAFREAFEAGDDWWEAYSQRSPRSCLEYVIGDKKLWGLRARTWTSSLYVIRRFVRDEPVSEPIEAPNEAAALAFLIHDAGGRLTSDDSARNARNS